MNFKKFIRRMNRGIALGIVFALAMTVFVIVDERRFKKEEGVIEQTILDYYKDIGNFNVEISKLMTPGEKATSSQADAANEKMKNLISTYYTDGKFDTVNGYYKEQVESAFQSYIKSMVVPIVTEQEFILSFNGMEITKYGAGGARVYLNGEYNTKLKGNFNVFHPGSYTFYAEDQYFYGVEQYNGKNYVTSTESEGSEDNKLSFDKLYQTTFSVNANLYLSRTDDGWKIVKVSSNSNYRGSYYDITDTASRGNDSFAMIEAYIVPQTKKYFMGGQQI